MPYIALPFFEIVGIAGVLQILLAYLLLQLDKLTTRTLAYQLLNAIGAALILYSLYFRFNLSAVTIEICWLLISIYGIVRIFIGFDKPEPNPHDESGQQ